MLSLKAYSAVKREGEDNMDAVAGGNGAMRGKIMFMVFLTCGAIPAAAAAADLMSTICNNQVVSVGARQGEVLAKCGPPLAKSRETVSARTSQALPKKKTAMKKTEKDKAEITKKKKANNGATVIQRKTTGKREETWTYNIDGSYRFFIFQEGKLANIEAGGLVN
jgi:hypothetical protein